MNKDILYYEQILNTVSSKKHDYLQNFILSCDPMSASQFIYSVT